MKNSTSDETTPHVSIGYTLSPDNYHAAAENLKRALPVFSGVLKRINYQGKGEKDALDFSDDIMLAVTALKYVAEFASDKCRFIPL